ncbi:uncharacterized protein MRET_1208 [Malassezia restricta]|uniref:uncharacterized protein n=1 Tax=Malassezia restricta TaxID=76775 RepID=UPI000DD16D1A|nr:uncharacterized protein MRET_1208 [Malassezia restricta]AXA48929.1 uncharacterized protein MRET_1208 [Malassezia restricta]
MAFSPRAHRRRTRAAGALLGGGASTSSSETANSSAGRLGLTRLLAALVQQVHERLIVACERGSCTTRAL